MRAVLLDASIYINAWRAGEEADSIKYGLSPYTPVWLSAVVLEELYAGASRSDRHVIERLERDFGRVGRILAPSRSDWVRAGQVLAQLATRYGYERIGRRTIDQRCAYCHERRATRNYGSDRQRTATLSGLARFRPFRYEVRSI